MAFVYLRQELDCPICLSIYTDPVTLRCGHNFCRVCIDRALDTQEGSGGYTCPECRAESQERPALIRNIPLCNIVGRFRITQPAEMETRILCTYCLHSPVPAVQSCVHCDAFLCDNHLRVHSKSPEHVLCHPTTSMQNRKCPIHKKILEYYCTEDAACICVYCSAGEHRGHNLEKLKEASEKKKLELRKVLKKLTIRREETDKRVQRLQELWREHHGAAPGVKETVAVLIRDLRRQLEDLEETVLNEISRQEVHTFLSYTDWIQQLEMQKDEVSREMRHIEELCNTSDPVTVLQGPSTGDFCDTEDAERDGTLVPEAGYQEMDLIPETLHTLSDIIKGINVCFYMQGPTDINTASNYLHISDDMQTASWAPNQSRPDTPTKFTFPQVLSAERFSSGQRYWELDVSKSGRWMVGVSYTTIHRRDDQSYIGENSKSWGLWRWRYNNQYSVRHDSTETPIRHNAPCHRVRIYLDYESGQLSFYALCDPIRHLHTFSSTFTEPLHVALCVWEGCITISGSTKLC